MNRRAVALIIAGALIFGPGGCASSSGPSAVDLNGAWTWLVTIAESTCGSKAGEMRSSTVRIEQNGQDVTIYLTVAGSSVEVPIRGTLSDRALQARGDFADPPWSLDLGIAGTVNDNSTRIDGTMRYDWLNTSDRSTCMERGAFNATR